MLLLLTDRGFVKPYGDVIMGLRRPKQDTITQTSVH